MGIREQAIREFKNLECEEIEYLKMCDLKKNRVFGINHFKI